MTCGEAEDASSCSRKPRLASRTPSARNTESPNRAVLPSLRSQIGRFQFNYFDFDNVPNQNFQYETIFEVFVCVLCWSICIIFYVVE